MYNSETPNVVDPLDSGQDDWTEAVTDEVLEIGHKAETALFVENSSFFRKSENADFIAERARTALFLREYRVEA